MLAVILGEPPGRERPGGAQQARLHLGERETPAPHKGEAVVRLSAAALNHRDLYLVQGARSAGGGSFVPGSDGAGTVEAVGEGVTGWKAGDAVIIHPTLYCAECSFCLAGEHSLCDTFTILGGPDDGTLAQYVRVPARNLTSKPGHLTMEEAAALPLALGTAWRALVTRAGLKPAETVLIHGIGGGVALFALQIAVAMGVRVIVTSGQGWKLERAVALGAAAGVNYREEDVAARVRELTGGAGPDLVVESGGKATLPLSLEVVRKGGRVVSFGATTGRDVGFGAHLIYWKQVSLIGSTMSRQADFDAAVAFVGNTGLKPTVSAVYPLEQVEQALAHMERADQFGKLVLRIP